MRPLLPSTFPKRAKRLVRAAQMALAIGFAAIVVPTIAHADEEITIWVDDAPLNEVAIRMSNVTGENFVVLSKSLQNKKISIYAPTSVSKDEACQLFISALRLQGLSVENMGAYWKIE